MVSLRACVAPPFDLVADADDDNDNDGYRFDVFDPFDYFEGKQAKESAVLQQAG